MILTCILHFSLFCLDIGCATLATLTCDVGLEAFCLFSNPDLLTPCVPFPGFVHVSHFNVSFWVCVCVCVCVLPFMALVIFRVFAVSTLHFPGLYFFGLCFFAGFLCFVSQVASLLLCGSASKCPHFFLRGWGGEKCPSFSLKALTSVSAVVNLQRPKPETQTAQAQNLKTSSPRSYSRASPKPCSPLRPTTPYPRPSTASPKPCKTPSPKSYKSASPKPFSP